MSCRAFNTAYSIFIHDTEPVPGTPLISLFALFEPDSRDSEFYSEKLNPYECLGKLCENDCHALREAGKL